jgi:YD repeat-containing protein
MNAKYSPLVILSLLFLIFPVYHVRAEIAGPGWFMGEAEPVSPEEARAYYTSKQARILAEEVTTLAATASATEITDEIKELARALQYDPKLIYDYVHNHIDYVPYFGSLKGATLTYLDGSGNDFDQASLMIALLRESSNYNPGIGTVQYVYGTMTIPGDQLSNWLGVDQNYIVIISVIANGGIPYDNYYADGTTEVDRVWVSATIDGTTYVFDPALKSYDYINKIDIGQATGYDRSSFLGAAQAGATVGSDYVQNLNEGNIGNKLREYSTNLINTIRNQYPNSDIKEIIGGRSIVQTNLTEYQTTLPYTVQNVITWNEVPSEYTATLQIQHEGINELFDIPEIAGKRLTLTYSGGIPELRLEGNLIASGNSTTTGNKYDLTITIDHPYAANNGTYIDQTKTFTVESGAFYAIVSDFGGSTNALLQKRQRQLNKFLANSLSETSEQVRGETLNIMGLTWMKELNLTECLSAALANVVVINHHKVGLMAQEAGYYIDVPMAYSSNTSKHNIPEDKWAQFKAGTLIASAFEHGMLEQLMGSDNPGISTIRIFQISNAGGQKIFQADQSNFSTIQSQLQNYSQSTLDQLQNDVNNGRTLILPQSGDVGLNQWSGTGYITKKFDATSGSIGMIISGGYYGGYAGNQADVEPEIVTNTVSNQVNTAPVQTNTFTNVSPVPKITSREPVDMAGGAYIYEHTDLSLGETAPKGLSFMRSYNSNRNLEKRSLGYGWRHNYDIYLERHSHGDPGLGSRQPVDAAALITELYVTLDLMKNEDTLLGWTVASLASKWAVAQLIDNAVTVHLGDKLMQFIKLPDGTYSPPPGITTELIDNGDGTFSLKERFDIKMNFDSNDRISQLIDADGNIMNFTYSGDKLSVVRDAFARTLTFNYTGNLIESVSDSAGRSVSFGYDSNDNLISYTDPEGKVWQYGYDTEHRMTSLTNPLGITTATNVYDSLGRVKEQTVPRQTGSATYKFYFSGFRNVEQDPDGYELIYYYDEKGRLIATEDQLGNKDSKEYDGQFHVVKTIDARGYITRFLYDGNQNLIRTTNALTQSTDYIYDARFRLTDTVDPLYHGTHIEYDDEHHPILTQAGVEYNSNFQPIDSGIFETRTSYYRNGLIWNKTDGLGTVTTLMYDSYGNPSTSQTSTHPAINYNYDSIGRLSSLIDQVGAITSFVYDNRGLIISKTDPLGNITSFYYDDAGRLDHVIDRNEDTITYTYTPTDKVESITYPNLSTVEFRYNQHDDLVEMQDSLGTTTYTYDAAHRLISQTDPHGFTVTYGYDEAGNLTEITYPGDKKVIYTYDELNRLITVKIDWLNLRADYYYDEAGRLEYFFEL